MQLKSEEEFPKFNIFRLHDVSKIDVFLMDWNQWMDELKVIYWNQPEGYWDAPDARTEDGRTFKELLLDACAYHKEVRFGMEK